MKRGERQGGQKGEVGEAREVEEDVRREDSGSDLLDRVTKQFRT
jgi:hypothetical protein